MEIEGSMLRDRGIDSGGPTLLDLFRRRMDILVRGDERKYGNSAKITRESFPRRNRTYVQRRSIGHDLRETR